MISIIIPFYNEKENLPILIDQLINQLGRIKKEYEIVLVDDGSEEISNIKDQISKIHIKYKKCFCIFLCRFDLCFLHFELFECPAGFPLHIPTPA